MSIDINVTVTLKPAEELITLVQRILNPLGLVPFTPHLNTKDEEPITYEEHLALKEADKPVELPKAKKTKVTEQAIEEAKAILKPKAIETPAQTDATPISNPDYSNITKDEIRALATEMQAHQGFNIRAFLDGLGYANISGIPAEKYPEVYALLKKEEVNY